MASFYGSDFKINFEKTNQIGAAWYSYVEPGYWIYNYVRIDTAGNILMDARNFDSKDVFWHKFDILADAYNPNPHLKYLTDEQGNSIIIYNYYVDEQSGEGWKLAWVKIDTSFTLSHNTLNGTSKSNSFTVYASKKYDFHLINGGEYRKRTKSERVNFLNYEFHYQKKKPHLIPPSHFIETSDNNLLCLSHYRDSAEIHYQCISPKGKFLFGSRAKINHVAAIIWDNLDLPYCEEIFQWNGTIWYITTVPSIHYRGQNSIVLIVFDKKGRITKHKAVLKTKLFSIDSLPGNAKRFIYFLKKVIYYLGIDSNGNLYYWNSKRGYIDYNRADLFAPFFAVHYNHVKDSFYNPLTENNLYPDSMNELSLWSKGGKLKHNMKLLIGCNKQSKTYMPGELIGIRCGIIHANLNERVFLAKAHYSPNKCGWPPEITIHINAPADAIREKMHLGYLGDDCIFINRPKSEIRFDKDAVKIFLKKFRPLFNKQHQVIA